jgi:Chaperone of endosialidase
MANQYINAMTALWNSAGTTYAGIKMNVTNSASEATSKLIQLQIAGTDKFSVHKDGHVTPAGKLFMPTSGVIDFGGTPAVPGDVLITHTTDTLTVSGGAFVAGGGFSISSTDAGATAGPDLVLNRDSASPAASDELAQIIWRGRDAGAAVQDYAAITSTINDTTAASEDATLNVKTVVAGAMTTRLAIDATGVSAYGSPTFSNTTTSPTMTLYKDVSPGTVSTLASITAKGRDGSSNTHDYGNMYWAITDATNASEDASAFHQISIAGTMTTRLEINATGVITYGDTMTVTSTDAGATAGPTLYINRDSASPLAADLLGQLVFRGRDSAANAQDYCNINATLDDPTSTSEDASLKLQTVVAGTLTTRLTLGATGIDATGQLRLPVGSDATTASTLHSFQIGTTGSTNLIIDDNEIIARSNGSYATLFLNEAIEVGGGTSNNINVVAPIVYSSTGNFWITSTVPWIRFTDTDTGSDAYIGGTSSTGSFYIEADDNNEVAGSAIFLHVDGAQTEKHDTNNAYLGPLNTTASFLVCRNSSTGLIYLSGGDSTSNGGNLRLYGGTHATQAGDWEFRSSSTSTLACDVSAATITTTYEILCGELTSSGDVTAFSDETLKRDSHLIDPDVAHRVMLMLRGYRYKRIDEEGDREHAGLMAQQVVKAGAPELVSTDAQSGKLKLNYNGLLAYVSSAYQHQEDRIAALEARLERAGL